MHEGQGIGSHLFSISPDNFARFGLDRVRLFKDRRLTSFGEYDVSINNIIVHVV